MTKSEFFMTLKQEVNSHRPPKVNWELMLAP